MVGKLTPVGHFWCRSGREGRKRKEEAIPGLFVDSRERTRRRTIAIKGAKVFEESGGRVINHQ